MADAPYKCELHMHSTFSDGSVSPEGLLRHAVKIGLTTVAITDHDTARGSRAALPIAAELGLDFIPAIEFTGRWDDCYRPGWGADVDVLGYFVDLDHPLFCAQEQASQIDMEARIAACCVRLTQAGYPVTFEEVRAKNPCYAGARQLRELLIDKGYAENYGTAIALFAEYWHTLRPPTFTIQEHIDTIHAAGGVAVLAHPNGIECDTGWIQTDRMARLVEMGIDGIEIYHRAMDEAARQYFLALAEPFGLLISGGSDEHGSPPDLIYMGQQPVTHEMVEGLRARHVERISNPTNMR